MTILNIERNIYHFKLHKGLYDANKAILFSSQLSNYPLTIEVAHLGLMKFADLPGRYFTKQ